MSDKCGNCRSTNLQSSDNDLWHYMRICNECGMKTRFNSKGEVVWVKEGIAPPPKTDIKYDKNLMSDRHTESIGSVSSIIDNYGRNKGTIDSSGNIKDIFGRITGHVDSFGNIKDGFGNIKGQIKDFTIIKKY